MQSEQALREQRNKLQHYLQADPDNADLACELADVCLQLGEISAITVTLERLSNVQPKHHGLQFRLASALISQQDFARAEELLRELLLAEIDALPVRYNLALAQLCLADAKSALNTLEAVAGREAGYPPLLLLRARAQHRLQHYDAALQSLHEFQDLRAEDAEAMGLLALILLDSGDTEAAGAVAQAALRLDSARLEALLAAAGSAIAQDRMDEAHEIAENAVSLHKESGRAWSLKAQTELARADREAAKASLHAAVEFMPDHIGTWHMLAWCQLLDNDVGAAAESFERARAIDRNFDETHGGLAVVAALRGDDAAARASIRRAQRLNPACFSARYAQSLLLKREGKTEQARQIIADVLNGPAPAGNVPLAQLVDKLAASLREVRR